MYSLNVYVCICRSFDYFIYIRYYKYIHVQILGGGERACSGDDWKDVLTLHSTLHGTVRTPLYRSRDSLKRGNEDFST